MCICAWILTQILIEFQNIQNSPNWNSVASLHENRLELNEGKMKFFEKIQEKFTSLGIKPQQKYALNGRSLSILLVFGLAIISTSVYVCNGSKRFDEYVACSYECSVISVGFLGIANCIWNTSKLYRLLNRLENVINESERKSFCEYTISSNIWTFAGLVRLTSKPIFDETDKKLQNWFGILDFVTVNVMSVCLTLPMLIVSFYTYFTTELANDAFQLPFYGA